MGAAAEVVDMVAIKRRRQDIERLDVAVATQRQSTVEIADAIRQCQIDEAWHEDDDFQDALATGRVDVANYNGSYLAAWASIRYGFAHRYTFKFAQAGEVRGVLASCPKGHDAELPATETHYRSLTKALNPTHLTKSGETPDGAERDEAIRRIWTTAIRKADGDPAAAAKLFPAIAKEDPYKPVARRFMPGLTGLQRDERRAEQLKSFRLAGRRLVQAGRWVEVEEVFAELQELAGR